MREAGDPLPARGQAQTKRGDDQFGFINEERNKAGSWAYIDEWRFQLESI